MPKQRGKPFSERVPLVGIAEEIDHDCYRNQDQDHFSHREIPRNDLGCAADGAERTTGGTRSAPRTAASGGDSMLAASAIIVWQQKPVWQLSQITAIYSRRTLRPYHEMTAQHFGRADAATDPALPLAGAARALRERRDRGAG